MDNRKQAGWLMAIGGGLVALGAFLPWVSVSSAFGSLSRNGLEGGGDGIVILILGVIIALVGITQLGTGKPINGLVALVLAVITAGIAYMDYVEVKDRVAEAGSNAMVAGQVGAGLYVIFVGAALALFGAIGTAQKRGTVAATRDPNPALPQEERFASVNRSTSPHE